MFTVALDTLTVVFKRCTRIFDAVIPVRCALCGEHGAHICRRCGQRWEAAPLVCRSGRVGLPPIAALGPYEGSLRTAILGLKFRNQRAAAIRLGAILGRKLLYPAEVIVPVPLHKRRLIARGFNQAEAIARGIASATAALVCSDALVRVRATAAQSSLLLSDRRHNVREAFAPGPPAVRLRRARVLLVDDVVTTGATVAACLHALRLAGVKHVCVAALAIKL